MKTEIESKKGRVFLIYKGEAYGSYPSGLISVEPRAGKSIAIRLGVSELLPDLMANTLINGGQLTPGNFEELASGIDGGADIYAPPYVLGGDTTSPLSVTAEEESVILAYPLMDTGTGDEETGSVEIPPATHETAGIMSAADKTKLDNLSEDGGGGGAGLPYMLASMDSEDLISFGNSEDKTQAKLSYKLYNEPIATIATKTIDIPMATTTAPGMMTMAQAIKLHKLDSTRYVHLASTTAQTFVSDIILGIKTAQSEAYKLLLHKGDDTASNGIGMGLYGTLERIEVGSTIDPLCLQHSAKASNGATIGKNIVVNYKDENGGVQEDAIAYLSDIPEASDVPVGYDYSGEERPVMIRLADGTVRQKKWIDGLPVYTKTITISALPSNTTATSYAHNINLGVNGRVIGAQAFASDASRSHIPLPCASTTLANNINMYYTVQNIVITCGTNRSTWNGTFILTFTKDQ